MRIVLLLLVGITLSVSAQAQRGNNAWKRYRHDFSIGYGFNTFLMNLGTNDKIGLPFMLQHSTFNASYRFFVAKHMAVRGSVTHAMARKNDKEMQGDVQGTLRLDYEMTLTEFAVMYEYHIFDETTLVKRKGKIRRARGGIARRVNFSPSFFAGIAYSYFRPYAEYNGEKMVLKPYNENAGFADVDDYKRWNLHFPIGTTIRFVMSENWRMGFEFGYRIGVRDYIGNVSTIYYDDPNPYPQRQAEYDDTQFTGSYATFAEDDGPASSFATEKGKSDYFFGTVTLTFRLKS